MLSKDRRQRIDTKGNYPQLDKYLDVLIGQKTIVPTVFMDPQTNNPTLFFLINTVGIRISGDFKILCHIVDLDE
jgi:hypothetical protein